MASIEIIEEVSLGTKELPQQPVPSRPPGQPTGPKRPAATIRPSPPAEQSPKPPPARESPKTAMFNRWRNDACLSTVEATPPRPPVSPRAPAPYRPNFPASPRELRSGAAIDFQLIRGESSDIWSQWVAKSSSPRLLASSPRDLPGSAGLSSFRDDLTERIAGSQRLPPLVERRPPAAITAPPLNFGSAVALDIDSLRGAPLEESAGVHTQDTSRDTCELVTDILSTGSIFTGNGKTNLSDTVAAAASGWFGCGERRNPMTECLGGWNRTCDVNLKHMLPSEPAAPQSLVDLTREPSLPEWFDRVRTSPLKSSGALLGRSNWRYS